MMILSQDYHCLESQNGITMSRLTGKAYQDHTSRAGGLMFVINSKKMQ
jgi:hypothetical protein